MNTADDAQQEEDRHLLKQALRALDLEERRSLLWMCAAIAGWACALSPLLKIFHGC